MLIISLTILYIVPKIIEITRNKPLSLRAISGAIEKYNNRAEDKLINVFSLNSKMASYESEITKTIIEKTQVAPIVQLVEVPMAQ